MLTALLGVPEVEFRLLVKMASAPRVVADAELRLRERGSGPVVSAVVVDFDVPSESSHIEGGESSLRRRLPSCLQS